MEQRVNRGFGLLFEMGCGKTLTALAIAGAAYEKGKIQKVLIIAPTFLLRMLRTNCRAAQRQGSGKTSRPWERQKAAARQLQMTRPEAQPRRERS